MWPWSSAKNKGSEAWTDVTKTGLQSGSTGDKASEPRVQREASLKRTASQTSVGLKTDRSTYLSARQDTFDEHSHKHGEAEDDEDKELILQPSFPLPLIIFVSGLSILAGLVVTGVHYAVIYSGCPLGVNGCNAFMGKEEKGFFLVKAVTSLSEAIPEDLVYILVSVIGAAVYVWIHSLQPENLGYQISGGGTVQSLIAVATGERITLKAAGLRVITSCIYLGSGGTLGFDGPAIQVCTAATTCVGWAVGMRSMPTQSLLACLGFAAGFAASFNSPLAGILFSMEELQHVSSRLSKHIICLILMASIIATAVARACSGNYQLLEANWGAELFESVQGGSLDQVFGTQMWMLVAVPIGIFCSLWGYGIHRSIRWIHKKKRRQPPWLPFSVAFVLHALVTACIGSAVFRITKLRGIWGIGYESLQEAFNRHFLMTEYLLFAGGKSIALVLGVAFRAPGDMLEPVLISGAFLGGSIGSFLQGIIEDDFLASQVMRPCLLFGMVGLFASCFRFPLTPVVIVLELMGVETYALVLPAALAGFTAITISNRLFPPLLDEVMHQDHIDLHKLSAEADAAHAALDSQAPSEAGSDQESIQETEPESESELGSRREDVSEGSSRRPSLGRSGSRTNTGSSSHSAMQQLLNNIEASMQNLVSPMGRSTSDGAREAQMSAVGSNPLLRSLERTEMRTGTGSRSNSRCGTDPSTMSSGPLMLNILQAPNTHPSMPGSPGASVALSVAGGQPVCSSGRQSSKSSNRSRQASPFHSSSGHLDRNLADELKKLTLLESRPSADCTSSGERTPKTCGSPKACGTPRSQHSAPSADVSIDKGMATPGTPDRRPPAEHLQACAADRGILQEKCVATLAETNEATAAQLAAGDADRGRSGGTEQPIALSTGKTAPKDGQPVATSLGTRPPQHELVASVSPRKQLAASAFDQLAADASETDRGPREGHPIASPSFGAEASEKGPVPEHSEKQPSSPLPPGTASPSFAAEAKGPVPEHSELDKGSGER